MLTVDNQIDMTTGTVKLRALFDNKDSPLFPNQFVNIQLVVNALKDQIVMPNAAVHRGAPNGVTSTFVYLVNRRQHRVRAAGDPRRGRRRACRHHQRASGRAMSSSPKAATGCGTAHRSCCRPTRRNIRRPPRPDSARKRERRQRDNGQRQRHTAGNSRRHPLAARMNPSRLFILRPVATTLLMVAILVVGMIAYLQLPLSALPEVAYPTIQVQTFYPGASPEVITSAITAPLEKQFGQMPGLNQMSSTSSAGRLGHHADSSTCRWPSMSPSRKCRPPSAPRRTSCRRICPPRRSMRRSIPADAPVLTLGITSKVMPLTQVEDLADTRVAQKISQIKGVGVVSISGGQRPAVRVIVNPRALAAYGLNLDDLRTTINVANQNGPKGTLDGPSRAYTINTNDQIRSADEYGNIVIAYRNSSPVRLKDVATLVESAENTKLGGWMNKTPALIVNVQRQPGANVVDVVNRIQALLPELKASLPAGVDVAVLTDRTTTIRASIRDVEFEMALAVVLVVLVIFLFLRNIPATLIPSLSVPLSLVGTFAVMYLANFSLNNLSLMALTIATGFVVDDAIVMIENISRYIEEGERPLEAALKGAGPDRLHHHLADCLADRRVDSAAVHAGRGRPTVPRVRGHAGRDDLHLRGRLADARADDVRETAASTSPWNAAQPETTGWFAQIIDWYGRRLKWVFDHQRLTLYVAVATLVLTALLYILIPKGFFPDQDTGLIQGVSEATEIISYAAMADRQQALAAAILKDPDVASLSSFIGVDGNNVTLNSGRFLINLKPRADRSTTAPT